MDSNNVAPVTITSYSGWTPIIQQKTPSGVYGLGCYHSAVHLIYMPDGDTSNSPRQMLELGYNGSVRASGKELSHVFVQGSQLSPIQVGDIWFS